MSSMLQALLARQHRAKLIGLAFWIAVLIGYQWYTIVKELTPFGLVRQLIDQLQRGFMGPAFFLIFYVLQPLVFFPSWLLTVAAGTIYGPLWGSIYVTLASNLSSLVAYAIGAFFGRGLLAGEGSQNVARRWASRMRRRSFETVLVMRFLFLPYDIVSYLAGFLRIRLLPFMAATAIGSLPGTVAFVFFGASIEGDFTGQKIRLDPWAVSLSVGLMISSLILWRYFSRRSARS